MPHYEIPDLGCPACIDKVVDGVMVVVVNGHLMFECRKISFVINEFYYLFIFFLVLVVVVVVMVVGGGCDGDYNGKNVNGDSSNGRLIF